MDKAFIEAFVHDEVSGFWRQPVLGRKLRPYSVWHQFLLEAIQSPLVMAAATPEGVHPPPPAPKDFHRAVCICTGQWPQRRFGAGMLDYARTTVALAGKSRFVRQIELFASYRADYAALPDYTFYEPPQMRGDPPRRSVRLGSPPEVMRLLMDAGHASRVSIRQAWNMGVGEAHWWQAMHYREKGSMLDFTDADRREHLRAAQEKFEREHPEIHQQLLSAAARWRGMKFGNS